MLEFGTCPVCKNQLTNSRLSEGLLACHSCGWSDNRSYVQLIQQIARRYVGTISLISILLVGSFIHAINWDSHFISVMPLLAKKYTETATIADYEALAVICEERMKYDCVEDAHRRISVMNPQNIELLARYAKTAADNKRTAVAAAGFREYFEKGGKSPDAAYEYAKVLGEAGYTDNAVQYYQYAIDAKPGILQITVTESYVNLLFKTSRLNEALAVIQNTRKNGSPYFMQTKFDQIREMVAN